MQTSEYNPFKEIFANQAILEAKLDLILSIIEPQEKSLLMSRNSIKEEFNVSFSTIHAGMRNSTLPYSKRGGTTVFKRKDVEHWIKGK